MHHRASHQLTSVRPFSSITRRITVVGAIKALMFRLSTIRRLRRAQQRAPAPRTSSRSTSGRAGRASLETAGGCQCCPYTRTDRYHRVSVQQQQSRAAAAPAPGSIVGTSLLTDGGVTAIKWARIAPNFPRCGARLDGRNAPAAALPMHSRRLFAADLPRAPPPRAARPPAPRWLVFTECAELYSLDRRLDGHVAV